MLHTAGGYLPSLQYQPPERGHQALRTCLLHGLRAGSHHEPIQEVPELREGFRQGGLHESQLDVKVWTILRLPGLPGHGGAVQHILPLVDQQRVPT
jgi:hypothetical protein